MCVSSDSSPRGRTEGSYSVPNGDDNRDIAQPGRNRAAGLTARRTVRASFIERDGQLAVRGEDNRTRAGARAERRRRLSSTRSDELPARSSSRGEAGAGKTTPLASRCGARASAVLRVFSGRPVEAEARLPFAGLGDLVERARRGARRAAGAPGRALEVALLLEHRRPPQASGRLPSRSSACCGRSGASPAAGRRGRRPVARSALGDPRAALRLAAPREEPVGLCFAPGLGATMPLGLRAREERLSAARRSGRSRSARSHLLRSTGSALLLPRPRSAASTSVRAATRSSRSSSAARSSAGSRLVPGEPLPVPDALVHERLEGRPAEPGRRPRRLGGFPSRPSSFRAAPSDGADALRPALEAQVVELDGDRIRFAHPLLASASYGSVTRSTSAASSTAASPSSSPTRRSAPATLRSPSTGRTRTSRRLSSTRLRMPARAERARRRRSSASRPPADAAGCGGRHPSPDDRRRSLLLRCRRPRTSDRAARGGSGRGTSGSDRAEALAALSRCTDSGATSRWPPSWPGRRSPRPGRTIACAPKRRRGSPPRSSSSRGPRGGSRARRPRGGARGAGARHRLADGDARRPGPHGVPGGTPRGGRHAARHPGGGGTGLLRARARRSPRYNPGRLPSGPTSPEAAGLLQRRPRRAVVERGDEGSAPMVLANLALAEYLGGRWSEAAQVAEEAFEAALQTGQRHNEAFALRAGARPSFVEATTRARADAAECAGHRRGAGDRGGEDPRALGARRARALARARPRKARLLRPQRERLLAAGVGEPGTIRFVPDEIEALVALGRMDEAERSSPGWRSGQRSIALRRSPPRPAAAACSPWLVTTRPRRSPRSRRRCRQHDRVQDAVRAGATLLAQGIALRHARRSGTRARRWRKAQEARSLGAALWEAEAARAEPV